MKVKRIHSSHLRNNEHFQCHTEIKGLFEEFDLNALKLEPFYSQFYIPVYNAEDEALIKIAKSMLSEERMEADRRRDSIFRGMVDATNASLNHFDDEVLAAGKRLKIIFDTYGNVAQLPLNEETAAIYNLLQDLRRYPADMQKLGITAWADRLESENNAYEALVKAGIDEGVAKTELKAKETRAEMDKVFRQLAERIEALALIEADQVYAELMRRLNLLLDKYANTLAQRQGQSKAKKKK